MDQPLQITFRDFASSPALEAEIDKRVHALERVCDRIISCRVLVEAPHHHHRKGRLFHVRIEVALPGREIVVSTGEDPDHAHEDVYVAVRDAFDAARRRLDGTGARRRRVRGAAALH